MLGLRPTDDLNLNFGYGRARYHDRELSRTRYTDDYNIGIDWLFFEDWAFTGTLGLTDEDVEDNISNRDSVSGQAQISYRFELPGPGGRRLPGQWFLRYTRENF
ncbi:MAG: hypothetical protein R3F37_21030 [Candidatus Competibacteraceae bacterium]